ncbi:MAG: hypothetical protein ABEH78_00225 [Haloferacaceae archaeon]
MTDPTEYDPDELRRMAFESGEGDGGPEPPGAPSLDALGAAAHDPTGAAGGRRPPPGSGVRRSASMGEDQ